MGRLIVLVLLVASKTQAFADQKAEILALEELFQRQSTAVFSSADWHQEISLTIEGCMFSLQNEQHLPPNSAQRSYVEKSYFDLRQIRSRADQTISKPNKSTVYLSWVKLQSEFIKTMEIIQRYMKAGEEARQRLEAAGNSSMQALANMSEKLWMDELTGPDGDYLRRSYLSREAVDQARDPRRVYTPLSAFGLHVRPEDYREVVKSIEEYAEAWCQP